jgi:L-ascorbate metabolism protein UlaG (beta-lactamase superfamily)
METTAARLTWLGHSTVLVELDGVRVLTDPTLRRRIGHLQRDSPVDAAALGRLDLVLVSHVHYDHLDLRSLEAVDAARIAVPAGAAKLLRRRRIGGEIVELAEREELEVGEVRVRATHAVHGAARRPGSPELPSLGFVVDGSRHVYFAGDTDLFDGMASLAPQLDVALLPVAGWGPKLPPGHMDPAAAAEAVQRLRPRIAVPVHWGTYRPIYRRTSYDPDAAATFAARVREVAPDVEVRVLGEGESFAF